MLITLVWIPRDCRRLTLQCNVKSCNCFFYRILLFPLPYPTLVEGHALAGLIIVLKCRTLITIAPSTAGPLKSRLGDFDCVLLPLYASNVPRTGRARACGGRSRRRDGGVGRWFRVDRLLSLALGECWDMTISYSMGCHVTCNNSLRRLLYRITSHCRRQHLSHHTSGNVATP